MMVRGGGLSPATLIPQLRGPRAPPFGPWETVRCKECDFPLYPPERRREKWWCEWLEKLCRLSWLKPCFCGQCNSALCHRCHRDVQLHQCVTGTPDEPSEEEGEEEQ